eukprot:SAG11_NODE_1405_length_5002_cov_4.030797_5_plen_91_part_00
MREQAHLMHVACDDGGEWDIEFRLGVGEEGRREVAEADAELNRRSLEGSLLVYSRDGTRNILINTCQDLQVFKITRKIGRISDHAHLVRS